jgi:hypothetical protein
MADKQTAADLVRPYIADADAIISAEDAAKAAEADKAAKEATKTARNAGIAAAVAVAEFFVLSEDKRTAKVFTKGGADGLTMTEYPSAETVVVPPPAPVVPPSSPVIPPVTPVVAPVVPPVVAPDANVSHNVAPMGSAKPASESYWKPSTKS